MYFDKTKLRVFYTKNIKIQNITVFQKPHFFCHLDQPKLLLMQFNLKL